MFMSLTVPVMKAKAILLGCSGAGKKAALAPRLLKALAGTADGGAAWFQGAAAAKALKRSRPQPKKNDVWDSGQAAGSEGDDAANASVAESPDSDDDALVLGQAEATKRERKLQRRLDRKSLEQLLETACSQQLSDEDDQSDQEPAQEQEPEQPKQLQEAVFYGSESESSAGDFDFDFDALARSTSLNGSRAPPPSPHSTTAVAAFQHDLDDDDSDDSSGGDSSCDDACASQSRLDFAYDTKTPKPSSRRNAAINDKAMTLDVKRLFEHHVGQAMSNPKRPKTEAACEAARQLFGQDVAKASARATEQLNLKVAEQCCQVQQMKELMLEMQARITAINDAAALSTSRIKRKHERAVDKHHDRVKKIARKGAAKQVRSLGKCSPPII
jgi:hypothetical protein